MTSAAVVASLIVVSIMATAIAAVHHQQHGILAFQISPNRHSQRCHRFGGSTRTNNETDESKNLLRRHLDEDSGGGSQQRRRRRPHTHLGLSLAPLVR